MKTRIYLKIIGLIFIQCKVFGQLNISQLTYASSSVSYQGSTLMIDYTIGELAAVTTLRDSSYILTQGLHQPDKYFVGFDDYQQSRLKISVFPNPFNDNISIEMESTFSDQYQIQIFDAIGKLVFLKEDIAFSSNITNHSVDPGNLAEGIYYMRIQGKSKMKPMSLPLIKAKQ